MCHRCMYTGIGTVCTVSSWEMMWLTIDICSGPSTNEGLSQLQDKSHTQRGWQHYPCHLSYRWLGSDFNLPFQNNKQLFHT